MDAAKLTNVRISRFRQCRDLVRESEMFIKDKAKIACRVIGERTFSFSGPAPWNSVHWTTHHFWSAHSRLFVFVQYFLIGWFRPSPCRHQISVVPQQITTKFVHKVGMWSRLRTYFRKLFSLTPKKFGGGLQIIDDYHQSEAHNLETAQHIDKWTINFSSIINVLHNATKLGGHHPTGFDAT